MFSKTLWNFHAQTSEHLRVCEAYLILFNTDLIWKTYHSKLLGLLLLTRSIYKTAAWTCRSQWTALGLLGVIKQFVPTTHGIANTDFNWKTFTWTCIIISVTKLPVVYNTFLTKLLWNYAYHSKLLGLLLLTRNIFPK